MAASDRNPDRSGLLQRIAGHTTDSDERRLSRRVQQASRIRDAKRRHLALVDIANDVERARHTFQQRLDAELDLSYPTDLPVSAARPQLLAAIAENQVVVIAGETGSGKTTQIPKMCLELGRGRKGMIGHTQPRRIAARAVAERLAEETKTTLGGPIGFQVRFTAKRAPNTLVKVMTDGILLAEISHDRLLGNYDTIIIDEAHERSLTIDFLLGYLKEILPQRPDLKVIITSATIDPQRFSKHFGNAPILEVSGRTYPVEIRYRPIGAEADELEVDQPRAIRDAIDELAVEGPGDILVFLAGEREIRDTADFLAGHQPPGPRPVEVVPLYGRLSAAEQHRVFAPHQGRRLVLATNVAETSLTVPGIRYVIDAGNARISRFSPRRKVQRLPIEPISQASARQRSGRCGRVADGIAIRLYSEEDFEQRPAFTDPEITRTNLASVLLQMAALGLGDIADFPFLDPPDGRHVRSGIQLLTELGALADGKVTPLGRRLNRLPVDPRIGRMILAADREGALADLLIIAAALSIQDPRERPQDKVQAATAAHARFNDPTSDFLAYRNLWNYLEKQRRDLSNSAFRRMCSKEFLNYQRLRQWQDLVGQLRQITTELGLKTTKKPASSEAIHRSLLSGLLSHVGTYDTPSRTYRGARGAVFALSPGSSLAKKKPPWVMVAELVETNRLWGHTAAIIDPAWIEEVAADQVERQYLEPRWDIDRGAVLADERITLYGLPVVSGRTITYSNIEPVLCRQLFIEHALVENEWHGRHRFVADNKSLIGQITAEENKVRRRDLLVGPDELYEFFDERIPHEIVSVQHFDAWWRRTQPKQQRLLHLTRAKLLSPQDEEQQRPEKADRTLYPLRWIIGDVEIPVRYRFDPGSQDDGVLLEVPLGLLPQPAATALTWGVPGQRAELVTALLRSLPKQTRKALVPIPDTVSSLLETLGEPADEPLRVVVTRELQRLGHPIEESDFDLTRVPGHLQPTLRVMADGVEVGRGKDLAQLRLELAARWQDSIATKTPDRARQNLRRWDFGDLAREVSEGTVTFYPALVDAGDSVNLTPMPNQASQERAMPAGITRLLSLNLPDPGKAAVRGLTDRQRLALASAPYPDLASVLADARDAALDHLGRVVWTEPEFAAMIDEVRPELVPVTTRAVQQSADALAEVGAVQKAIASLTNDRVAAIKTDLSQQLGRLVGPGFIRRTGVGQLPHLPRYLRAMTIRVDNLAGRAGPDLESMLVIHELEDELDTLPLSPAVVAIEWQLEELRVSLFAPTLKTAGPISAKRIRNALSQAALAIS